MPEEYYGEAMAKGLSERISVDDKVMVCVPKEVDTELYKNLKSYEKQIDVVPLYDIVYEKNKDIKE